MKTIRSREAFFVTDKEIKPCRVFNIEYKDCGTWKLELANIGGEDGLVKVGWTNKICDTMEDALKQKETFRRESIEYAKRDIERAQGRLNELNAK